MAAMHHCRRRFNRRKLTVKRMGRVCRIRNHTYLYIDIRLAVAFVEIYRYSLIRPVRDLFAQTPPKNPFILITRDDIPQAVRLSDRKFLAFNRIIHKHFILSHLFDGRCKQHGAGLEHPRLRLRAGKALHQIAPQTVRVAIPGQNFGRFRQAKAQRPQGADTSGCTKLRRLIIAVSRIRVDIPRAQQAKFIVMAQHTDTDHRQPGKFADPEHAKPPLSFLHLCAQRKHTL